MKKFLLLVIIIILLTGCGAESINEKHETNDTYYIQDSLNFDFYVDKETCVEYIIFNGGYRGGITPRLNADGTLKLNKICLKDEAD